MQQIMTQCFLAVKFKLDRRLGFFDLIGCDFMVDEDFKVWTCSRSVLCVCVCVRLQADRVWFLTGVVAGDELQPCSSHKLRGVEGCRPQDCGGGAGSVH